MLTEDIFLLRSARSYDALGSSLTLPFYFSLSFSIFLTIVCSLDVKDATIIKDV